MRFLPFVPAAILIAAMLECRDVDMRESCTVARISQIAPLKVMVGDFVSIDEDGVKALYHICGDALVAVDVSTATFTFDSAGRVKVSGLAAPRAVHPRIDGERSELLDQSSGVFTSQSTIGKIHDRHLALAQELIAKAASAPEILKKAKLRAETIIRAFYARNGIEVTEISWEAAP